MSQKSIKVNIKKNLIRRLNLLMLLLNQPQGQSKTEIFARIPEYSLETSSRKETISRDRAFNRDKEELAAAGFSMRVDSDHKYYINRDEIFCDALELDGKQRQVLRRVASLWQDGALKVAVHGALLKLGIIPEEAGSAASVMFSYGDDKIFTVVEALNAKKALSFNYQAAGAKDAAAFTVEVWGVIGLYGQWYLHAFDRQDKILKFFRVDRIVGDLRIGDILRCSIPPDYQPQNFVGDIAFPREGKYCVIAGAPKYLEAVPLAEVSDEEYEFIGVESMAGQDGLGMPRVNGHHKIFSYSRVDDAATRLIPFLDTIEVLYPQQLKDEMAAIARQSLRFQGQISADTQLNDKHSTQVHKDRIPDLLRVFGIAMLNANGTQASYDALLKYLGIDEAQLNNDLHTLNYIENLADAAIDFGYIDVDEISQERELLGAAGASAQGVLQLTRHQVIALLISLRILQNYAEWPDGDTIDSLQNKFASMAHVDRSVLSKIYVSAVSIAADKENIAPVRKAIAEGKSLQMDYLDAAKISYGGRTIKPLKTYSVNGLWYVQAWCYGHQEKRNFRCDRMKNPRILEAGGKSSTIDLNSLEMADIDVMTGAEAFESAFSAGDSAHDVVAVLGQSSDRFIKDYFVQRIKNYENHPLVNKVVQVTIKNSDYFARFLVSLGGRIAILSPAEDARRCQEYALKIIDLYRKQVS